MGVVQSVTKLFSDGEVHLDQQGGHILLGSDDQAHEGPRGGRVAGGVVEGLLTFRILVPLVEDTYCCSSLEKLA